jgi:hypothetical protein
MQCLLYSVSVRYIEQAKYSGEVKVGIGGYI